MEKLPDNKTQEKLAKVFKAIISAGLVAPVFVSVSACEKAKPVVEEAQSTAIIPTTIETAPPTTQETIPPTTETTPETTAEVIINAPEITGLKFDNSTKTYFAEAGNPYGLKEGEVAGVFIPNVLTIETIDGTSGKFTNNVIELKSEVIKVLQAQALKEKGEYFFPLLVDVRNIDSLGLTELKSLKSEVKYLGITLPINANFYCLLDANFETVVGSDYQGEFVMATSFDVKSKDMEGVFRIYVMKENLLLDNKKFELTKMETADGKEFTIKTIHISPDELMGTIISEKPLRVLKDKKQVEDKGENQIILQILGKNRKQYLGGLDNILTVDNNLVAYLPEESK